MPFFQKRLSLHEGDRVMSEAVDEFQHDQADDGTDMLPASQRMALTMEVNTQRMQVCEIFKHPNNSREVVCVSFKCILGLQCSIGWHYPFIC